MNPNPQGDATPPAAPSGSPSAGSPAANDPLERLLQMQEQMGQSAAGGTEESSAATAPTDGAPASSQEPDPAAATGQDVSGQSSEDDTAALLKSEPGSAEPEPGAGEAEAAAGQWPAELAGLPDDVRNGLLAMAKEVADGKTSFGELKRGHKLIGRHAEQLEQLRKEIDGLKSARPEPGDGAEPPGTIEAAVARLKTPEAIAKRAQQLKQARRWCEANAAGGEFNGATFTAEQVAEMKYAAEDEAEMLPGQLDRVKAEQARTQQWQQQQANNRRIVLEKFPHLKDEGNAEAVEVQDLLEAQPWLKTAFVSPELAGLIWVRGRAAVYGELKAKGKGGTVAGAGKAGAVPKGRPGGGGSAAGGRPASAATVAAAKEQISKERSVAGLAKLTEATGLG